MFQILPERNIESQRIDSIFVSLQFMQKCACLRIPDLASSIITTSDEPES
jgi:hypothetical protein